MNQASQLFQIEPTPIVPPDRLGLVGEFLVEFGIPESYATFLGPFLALILAFLILYGISRAVLRPIFDWMLTRRGVNDHSKRLLLRLSNGIVIFFSITIAFSFAGYGPVLDTPTVWIAALCAIGFVFRRRLADLLFRVMEYSEPNR